VRAVQRFWPGLALVIHAALLSFVPDFGTERADSPLKFVAQLTITPSNLWYLYALAVYFVIAKAARRVPVWLVLGRAGVYQNLVFFLAGLCGKQLIEGLTNALAGVGRRTLPIYVIHTPLLALVSCGADQAVVLTAFLAWLCLFLYRYLPKALFELPFGLGGSRSDAAAYRRTTSLTSQ
jgi:hypothetical protein